MNVAELLNQPIFDLPVSWVGYEYTNMQGPQTCRSYHKFVSRRLKEYQELLVHLEDIEVDGQVRLVTRVDQASLADEVRQAVHVLCTGIRDTLNAYANGSPSNAYNELCRALEPPGNAGLFIAPGGYFNTHSPEDGQVYYRLRYSSVLLTEPHELFHLPFEQRWRSRGYRFSIAGYPSLYAASSLQLALFESRGSRWSRDLYAAKLQAIPRVSPDVPIRSVRFLDLRNKIESFRRRYARPGPYSGEIMGFLVRWPLIMATSVPTGHPASAGPGFHEEYVLPQLLLEWVNNVRGRTHKITGIAFSSSRTEAAALTRAGHYNIVAPAEAPAAAGWCTVRTRQFEISRPVGLAQFVDDTLEQSVDVVARQLEVALDAEHYQRLSAT
jgi:hypothetical protein